MDARKGEQNGGEQNGTEQFMSHDNRRQVNCRYQLLPDNTAIHAPWPTTLHPSPPLMPWNECEFCLLSIFSTTFIIFIILGQLGRVAGKLWAFHNVNSRINTLFVSTK